MQSKKIFKNLFAVVLLIITQKTVAQQAPDSSFHIYLLMGQSNMAGRGYMNDSVKQEHNERVLVLNQSMQWVIAHHPLHYDKPGQDGVGPGLSFGIKMAESDPDTSIMIGLVPCAVGGTPIEHWKANAYDSATNTHPYDDAVRRIKEAMQKGVISGIIWHQGESDCNPRLASFYISQLIDLIGNIRNVVGNPNLPFIIGELGTFYTPHELINSQLPFLLEKIKNVGIVSSTGLTDRGDKLHFDAKSAEMLGDRYAGKMLEIQHLNVVTNPTKGK